MTWENKTKLIFVFLGYLFKLDFFYHGQPEAPLDAYLFLTAFGSIDRNTVERLLIWFVTILPI